MVLNIDAKFVSCGLENGMSNLINFHQSTRQSQNWNFYTKQRLHELNIYRGVMCYYNEE